MNKSYNLPSAANVGALESRFGLRVAAHLSEQSLQLGPDIGERLRVSREQALQRARTVRATQVAASGGGMTSAGAAILGDPGKGWWVTLGSALPLLALLAGLLLIQKWYADVQIAAAAEIDTALLADDLPPKAYGDAGFVEFLKAPRN
ncbi:MAG: DUF3619 family protein [Rhizobacter sp.]|nr:DUF3619 family protein [Rhizobacter sp.]